MITLTNEDLAVRDQFNVRELMVECMFDLPDWDQLLAPTVDANTIPSENQSHHESTENIII